MFASTFREELERRQGQFARIVAHFNGPLGTLGMIGIVQGDVVVLVHPLGYGTFNFPIDSIHSVIFSA